MGLEPLTDKFDSLRLASASASTAIDLDAILDAYAALP